MVTESLFSSGRASLLAWRRSWPREMGTGQGRQEETNRWAAAFMAEEGCYCLHPTCETQAGQVGPQCWDWSPWNLVHLYQLGCFCLYRTQILTWTTRTSLSYIIGSQQVGPSMVGWFSGSVIKDPVFFSPARSLPGCKIVSSSNEVISVLVQVPWETSCLTLWLTGETTFFLEAILSWLIGTNWVTCLFLN